MPDYFTIRLLVQRLVILTHKALQLEFLCVLRLAVGCAWYPGISGFSRMAIGMCHLFVVDFDIRKRHLVV